MNDQAGLAGHMLLPHNRPGQRTFIPSFLPQTRSVFVQNRDAKSEEHEERVPAIFPPAVLIFELPTQKNMPQYAKKC